MASRTDLVKWHCNSDQVFVGFASIPDNHKSPATNFCCKTKKEWCCMTCCVSNSCMYPCVPGYARMIKIRLNVLEEMRGPEVPPNIDHVWQCVPMLGRGRYASASHDRRIHVHEHAMRRGGTRPFSNRASQPGTAQKFEVHA